MARKKQLNSLGITCGVGSMLIGARTAGFRVLGNIEWRRYYHMKDDRGRSTFTHNFPKSFMVYDLSELEPERRRALHGVDIIFSHPECGNFSLLNHVNIADKLVDPADIPIAMNLIREIRPRFFVIDELPKSTIAVPVQRWVDKLPDYDIYFEWISNHHYGNIQKNRNRMFIIGALREENFIFTPGEAENPLRLCDVIGDLHGRKYGRVPNHHPHTLKEKSGRGRNLKEYGKEYTWRQVRAYFAKTKEGEVMRYIGEDGHVKRRMGNSKNYWEKHAHVLDGSSYAIHPRTNLPFSIRERARIQGTPDDFVFFGERVNPDGTWNHDRNIELTKQTGKFMPVQFCTYVAEQIYAHLRGKKFKTTGERVQRPNPFVDRAKKEYCRIKGYGKKQPHVCRMCWQNDNCEIKRERIGRQGDLYKDLPLIYLDPEPMLNLRKKR